MAYIHPYLTDNQLPTVGYLKQAIKQADQPDPALRDVRPIMAIVAAIPKADPDVAKNMQTRRLKVQAWPWSVQAHIPRGLTTAPQIEEQRAAEIDERIRQCGIESDFDALINGLFNGVAAIEPVWSTADGGAHTIVQWDVIDAVDMIPDPQSVVGWSRAMYDSPTSSVLRLRRYVVPEEIIIAKYNPMKGIQSNYYGGLLRSVIWHTMLKHGAWYDWAKLGEKYGDPPIYARYPVGAPAADIEKAFEFLQHVAQDASAVIPEDIKIDLIEALKSSVNIDVFDKFIERVSSRQEAIILGQDIVNSAAPNGNNAKALTANGTTDDLNWADIEWFQRILTHQLVQVDYRLNYGQPTSGYFPRFVVNTDLGEDYKTNAMILSQAKSAGWDAADAEEVSRKLGVRVVKAPPPVVPVPGGTF